MKSTPAWPCASFVAGMIMTVVCATPVIAQNNSWIAAGDGKWEAGPLWSAGTPSSSQAQLYITNNVTKTITIDAATVGTVPTVMTVSNLSISAPLGSVNTLFLNNAGLAVPLNILSNLFITSGGAIVITNSVLNVGGVGGGLFADDGSITLNTGSIIATNLPTAVGDFGQGTLTVSNGTMLARDLWVGVFAGDQGTLSLAGGTTTLSSFLTIGAFAGSTGTVWVTGGQLTVTNDVLAIGDAGYGQMSMSNGTVLASQTIVGGHGAGLGSVGTLTIAGGLMTDTGTFTIGNTAGSTGTVWVTGGQLNASNISINVGSGGVGQMTVSGGSVTANSVGVGMAAGSVGTLTVAGGSVWVSNNITVGSSLGVTGTLWVTGGQLTVATNPSVLVVTSTGILLGYQGVANMVVSNATVATSQLAIGAFAPAQGTLTVVGGTLTSAGGAAIGLLIGGNVGTTGTVWITGGQTAMPDITVGNAGVARMTLSNATVSSFPFVTVGTFGGSQGTLTMQGGTLTASVIELGLFGNSTGTMWATGAQISSGAIFVGDQGTGTMTLSNANTTGFGFVRVGNNPGSQGTLTIVGGTTTLFSYLSLGTFGGTGTVFLTGGQLSLPNDVIAVGDRAVGQMSIQNASVQTVGLRVGGNSLSNATGTLMFNGGTITTGDLLIGQFANSTGTVVTTSGYLSNSGSTTIGSSGGVGYFTMDSGTAIVHDVTVGPSSAFNFLGGTLHIGGNFVDTGGSTLTFSGNTLIIDPTGLLRLGSEITSVSSSVTNQNVFSALAPTFSFNAGLGNSGFLAVQSGQIMTVFGGMANSGQITVNSAGLLSIPQFAGGQQTGTIFLNGGGSVLNVASPWVNGGAVEMLSGSAITGAAVTNGNLIEGAGGVNVALINAAGATVRANGGLLTLNNANVQNRAGGVFESTSGSTLRVAQSLVNQGLINPQGGIIDLGANTLTNQGTLSGYGTYKAAAIVNNGHATYLGGNLNLEASYINNLGTTTVIHATATFFGAVTNNAGGVFKNTASQLTFLNTFYNNGSYISDPSTNVFTATLALGSSGALVGGKGDLFVLQGDLASANANGLQIDGATVEFTGGAHAFLLAGTARLGALQLDSGATLTLSGADLYVGALDASPTQLTSAYDIFYDPTQNPSLGGQTYALSGGGFLQAVPEPTAFALVLTALILGTLLLARSFFAPVKQDA